MFDRRGKPEDFVPVSGDLLRVHYAADERRKNSIAGWPLHGIEASVGKVADARSKPEPQQVP